MTTPVAPTGAIYDIGYRHYDGPRLGRRAAVRALYVQGLRSIFGLGRGVRAKIAPFALLAIVVIPAIIQSAIVGLTGGMLNLFSHQTYFHTTAIFFGFFCAAQSPELVSGDQRSRVLALYFSRAIHRSDYVLARVGALASALFVVALLPHFVLILGRVFSATDVMAALRATGPVLLPIFGGSLVIAIVLATVALAISASIDRRPFATVAILSVFILTNGVFGGLVQRNPEKMRYLALASPLVVSEGVSAWLFDTTAAPPAQPAAQAAAPVGVSADGVIIDRPTQDPIPGAGAGRGGDQTPQFGGRRGAGPGGRGGRPARVFRRPPPPVLIAAHLPGLTYLGTALAYILLASGALALRYHRIQT